MLGGEGIGGRRHSRGIFILSYYDTVRAGAYRDVVSQRRSEVGCVRAFALAMRVAAATLHSARTES